MFTALTIAGSDSSGGAGIQADIKTMSALGVYAMSVITAVTAQNTTGVYGIQYTDDSMIENQLQCVLSDIPPDAVKIGMLSSPASVEIIAGYLSDYNIRNIVIDPVMVSTSGDSLTKNDTVRALEKYLLPAAAVITPNIPEAEILSGHKILTQDSFIDAARELSEKYNTAVLIKGGHAVFNDTLTTLLNEGKDNKLIEYSTDILVCPDSDPLYLEAKRTDNPNTHGTGCTLSSAIASYLARGLRLEDSVRLAKNYVTGAINAKLNLGKGRGPLNHLYNLK